MIGRVSLGRRRWFAPEVVQNSAMDCGPAALASLLQGYGLPASYTRLQEACETDRDGTSINTLEEIAVLGGLNAEQVMIPADHFGLDTAGACPAVVVVARERTTHFVVAWRRHGRFVQVMDPARGRRLLRTDVLRSELYVHRQAVPSQAWRAWAGSPEFLAPLTERLRALGVPRRVTDELIGSACADERWQPLALLDAATRMVTELVGGGGLRRGREAGQVLRTIMARARPGVDVQSLVPESCWFAVAGRQPGELTLRGAVLVRVLGRREPAGEAPREAAKPDTPPLADLSESRTPPTLLQVWKLSTGDRGAVSAVLGVALLLAAAGALFEIMWLRGLLEVQNVLGLREQRLVSIAMLVGFVAGLMLLEFATHLGVLNIGRRIEARIRAAVLAKLPELSAGYFQRRLVSDFAHRAHSLAALRTLPEFIGRLLRTGAHFALTAAGLIWLDPASAPLVLLTAAAAVSIPFATERLLAERELRQRSHAAALARHYLDSLLGLVPLRVHGADRAVRHQHERLLVEWGRASLHLVRGTVVIDGLQLLTGSLLAAWLVLGFVSRGTRPGSTMLLVYWTLSLPVLARELAAIVRQLPAYRNILARVAEPLAEPSQKPAVAEAGAPGPAAGVALEFRAVTLSIRGQRVLQQIDLAIAAGEHVAIVGRSGAGKSTLAGLLLGWHLPSDGTLLVDGEPLDATRLEQLRRATAWVDPGIHLWNQSVFENLRYGTGNAILGSIGALIDQADLIDMLERLPAGLQSPLGEGGRLTSGGEGQRIRFGRALAHPAVRLAIMDEPFRGLDRPRRRELLSRARHAWRDRTLLCVTHDLEDTLAFERVVVLQGGRVVEDGNPAQLADTAGSSYAALLRAERAVQDQLWGGGRWRHWRLEEGAVREEQVTWTETRYASRGQ